MPLSVKESFSWLQLLGFIILIIGSVIFNEIVELHCLGFDKKLTPSPITFKFDEVYLLIK